MEFNLEKTLQLELELYEVPKKGILRKPISFHNKRKIEDAIGRELKKITDSHTEKIQDIEEQVREIYKLDLEEIKAKQKEIEDLKISNKDLSLVKGIELNKLVNIYNNKASEKYIELYKEQIPKKDEEGNDIIVFKFDESKLRFKEEELGEALNAEEHYPLFIEYFLD